VLARTVCDDIKKSGVKFYEIEYHKKYLNPYLMLYSCLNNEKLNKQIVIDGKEAGVLVNIHDEPKLCQFVSPAIVKNGNITIAVGSNGENVYESIRIRNLIQNNLQIN